MINLLSRSVDNPALLYSLIIVFFIAVVGLALFLTPRLAAFLDKNKSEHKGFYDDMMTEDPNAVSHEESGEEDKEN